MRCRGYVVVVVKVRQPICPFESDSRAQTLVSSTNIYGLYMNSLKRLPTNCRRFSTAPPPPPPPRRRTGASQNASIQFRDPSKLAPIPTAAKTKPTIPTRPDAEKDLDHSPTLYAAKAFLIATALVGGSVAVTMGGAFVFLGVDDVRFFLFTFAKNILILA